MKKYIFIIIALLFITGCSTQKKEEYVVDETLSIKRACCADSGGVWQDNKCSAPDRNELYYSEELYEECVDEAIYY